MDFKNMPYKEYLQTVYWITVKTKVKERASYKCQLCGCSKGEMHTHHNSYEHRGEELDYLEDLIYLCKSCHSKYHDKELQPNNDEFEINQTYLNGRYDILHEIIDNLLSKENEERQIKLEILNKLRPKEKI